MAIGILRRDLRRLTPDHATAAYYEAIFDNMMFGKIIRISQPRQIVYPALQVDNVIPTFR